MEKSTLSKRGEEASRGTPRVDLDVFFEASQNTYDPNRNPGGAFLLNMAENRHCWKMLRDQIRKNCSSRDIPDWVAGYTAVGGAPMVRQSIAHFLEVFITKCPVDPNRLALSAGATSVIEMTAFILGNPGEIVVFPAPAYPVYKQDVGSLAGLRRLDLPTHDSLIDIQTGPHITNKMLDDIWVDIRKAGGTWSMLVLTQPDNPTGLIYSPEDLRRIAAWCIEQQVHLVVNEIYALSLVNVNHPELVQDYMGESTFFSFARIMEELPSDYLHYWYAFSKDFGISGFRVGMLYSFNEDLLKAYNNLALGRCVSNHTQWILQWIIADHDFVQKYVEANQKHLTASYLLVIRTLRKLRIPYVPARGSLFVWADFSAYLKKGEPEEQIWMDIYRSTGILLTPGSGFGHNYEGAFRIVHTLVNHEDMMIAMKKLENFLVDRNVAKPTGDR